MRGEPRVEADVGEDDVLDAVADVGLAAGGDLAGVAVGQLEQHRDVVRTEAPERVLVGAELAEVEALGVQVVDVAEVALFDQVGELADPGVVTEQVPDHQGQVALGGQGHDALSQGRVLGQRLLDEAVLARLQRPDRQVPWVGTGVVIATACSSGSASSSSKSAVKLASG